MWTILTTEGDDLDLNLNPKIEAVPVAEWSRPNLWLCIALAWALSWAYFRRDRRVTDPSCIHTASEDDPPV